MIELIFVFVVGVIVGVSGFCIYEIERTRRFWRSETLGLSDFDIKCINEEYARRKGKC
jgi:hypothetical protein